jgi:hypothetical protein
MGDVVHIDAVTRLKQAAEGLALANPALVKALLAGGAGLLGGGALGAALMHAHDEQTRKHTRDRAFGAGVATGVAGPHIIDALHSAVHRGDQ